MAELFARTLQWPARFTWTLGALVVVMGVFLLCVVLRWARGYDHDGSRGGDR